MNPGLFWGTDDNRVQVWRRPDSSMVGPLPDLSPVEHVWDQRKRQMPSCHSVHDLELDVQDLWAHLPQDNIRCLINSVPDRVAACIAAGGVVQHAIEVAHYMRAFGNGSRNFEPWSSDVDDT
ncbi:transposable element Tcb2 transposase [Trichonephila clavipes]|nr:transposable element Tcb2 transposase [Trichonephila clavipes]